MLTLNMSWVLIAPGLASGVCFTIEMALSLLDLRLAGRLQPSRPAVVRSLRTVNADWPEKCLLESAPIAPSHIMRLT